jgi:monoterpene epsilon-lactone hydrolase
MEVYMPGAELSWDQIEATQNAANNKAGPRFVPGRSIPVPGTVSPSRQTTIAAPYRVPAWDANPKDAADWKTLISTLGDETAAATRDMQESDSRDSLRRTHRRQRNERSLASWPGQ